MSGQANAWQTARAPRQSQPNTRSGNSSPQPTTIPQGQRQERAPLSNVWTRSSQSSERPAQTNASTSEQYTPANGFNSAEVKAFLGKVAGASPAVYKPADAPGVKAAPWSKSGQLANGQSLFGLLAKQAAGLENGG